LPKPTPSLFFSALSSVAVATALSVALPGANLAPNHVSACDAQSAGDLNRPPSAQNARHTPQQPAASSAEQPAGSAPAGDDKILFDHVNESRRLAGLPALRWDAHLAAAARKHCALLVEHESLSHQFPGEADLKERLQQSGAEFSAAAENVALAGTPDELHDQWMHSPPHRANILDPQLTAIGIAEQPGHKGLYAVQDFTLAADNLSIDEQEGKIRALLAATGIAVADSPGHLQGSEARKTCQMSSGYAGKAAAYVKFDTADLSQLPARVKTLLDSGKYRSFQVGACDPGGSDGFTHYRIAVLLYP
jgi:uncharacterized protein YkwD